MTHTQELIRPIAVFFAVVVAAVSIDSLVARDGPGSADPGRSRASISTSPVLIASEVRPRSPGYRFARRIAETKLPDATGRHATLLELDWTALAGLTRALSDSGAADTGFALPLPGREACVLDAARAESDTSGSVHFAGRCQTAGEVVGSVDPRARTIGVVVRTHEAEAPAQFVMMELTGRYAAVYEVAPD